MATEYTEITEMREKSEQLDLAKAQRKWNFNNINIINLGVFAPLREISVLCVPLL
jgi:hypothetical protein